MARLSQVLSTPGRFNCQTLPDRGQTVPENFRIMDLLFLSPIFSQLPFANIARPSLARTSLDCGRYITDCRLTHLGTTPELSGMQKDFFLDCRQSLPRYGRAGGGILMAARQAALEKM